MAKILVTGGLGAVGSALTDELEGRGHDVWVADLPWSERDRYYRCDVSEFRQLAEIFEEGPTFDYVYHLAAEFGRKNGEDFYETMWQSNAIGTKNILRLQAEYDFRLIFFSSSEVYGDYNDIMHEEVPRKEGIRQLNDYAISKWVNEQQVMNAADRHGTESVRVRLFNTYGPGERYSEYRSVVAKFCYRALHDLPYHVYENHHRSFTYIEDTVRTLANIVDEFHPGQVYNIASEEYHSIEELSEIVLGYLGKDDDKVEYRGVEEHNTLNKKASITRAKQDLDHEARISLEDGVHRTIDWMKDYYDVE